MNLEEERMEFRQLNAGNLFDANGCIPLRFCARTWREGGDCYTPFQLNSGGQPIPEDERERVLQAVNRASWRIGVDGRLYCPACVQANASTGSK